MDIENLSAESKVWIYQSKRKLDESEMLEIQHRAEEFIHNWAAHGSALKASFRIIYDRFLVLLADETQMKASGCSIDASVHFFKSLEADFQLELFDRLEVAFQEDGVVKSMPLNEFQKQLQEGYFSEDTIVFNNLINTKSELDSKWEVPLKESWHRQLL